MFRGFIDLPGRSRYHQYAPCKSFQAAMVWVRGMHHIYGAALINKGVSISCGGDRVSKDLLAA